jgi:hypothetical protein
MATRSLFITLDLFILSIECDVLTDRYLFTRSRLLGSIAADGIRSYCYIRSVSYFLVESGEFVIARSLEYLPSIEIREMRSLILIQPGFEIVERIKIE